MSHFWEPIRMFFVDNPGISFYTLFDLGINSVSPYQRRVHTDLTKSMISQLKSIKYIYLKKICHIFVHVLCFVKIDIMN